MRIVPIVLVVAAMLAGCERPEDAPPAPEEPAEPARPPAPEPEPFDTAGVIEEARMMEREVDADVDALTRLERTVDPEVPTEQRLQLILWERDERPVRLRVTVPETGEQATYHFDERVRLRYAQHPRSSYVFDEEGRLLVWIDEDGHPRHDVTEERRLARAAEIETGVRQYLDEFVRMD